MVPSGGDDLTLSMALTAVVHCYKAGLGTAPLDPWTDGRVNKQ